MIDSDVVRIGIEVGGMVIMGLSAFYAVKGEVRVLSRTIERIELQVSKIADIITDLRLIDQRLGSAEQDIRDLQRGEGKVIPLIKGAYEHGRD